MLHAIVDSLFYIFLGIAASEKTVVLADMGANCVHILTLHGQLLKCVGQKGKAPGDLYLPYGITLDKNRTIIVSEYGNHRISLFTCTGDFIRCFGCMGSDPGMFHCPRHLCLNDQGQIIVADEENQRLQLFNLNL